MCGVGLELRPFGPDVIAQLESFASGAPMVPPESAQVSPSIAAAPLSALSQAPAAPEGVAELAEDDEPSDQAASSESDADIAADQRLDDDEGDDNGGKPRDVQQQLMHERMRKLSQVEQQKVARQGDLSDRVMLERLYGRAVWEGLLHNPKLTVPEVARMARKGTMPRPMVDFILDNGAWVQQGSVRRALLGNPRVSNEGVLKILRATPKHELRVITKTTAYAAPVREAARKLLKG
jgi:hypothetical protein